MTWAGGNLDSDKEVKQSPTKVQMDVEPCLTGEAKQTSVSGIGVGRLTPC